MASSERPVFKVRPPPGQRAKGQFNLVKFVMSTVQEGGFHAMFLIPHFLLLSYVAYLSVRLLVRHNLVPAVLASAIDQHAPVLVSLLQGASVGAAIGLGFIRWGPAKQARVKAQGSDQEKGKVRLECLFALAVYFAIGTTAWHHLPAAESQ